MINLDHNATTPPTPEVVEAVNRGLTELWHNPSSVHRPGQASRHAMELARQSLAALVGVKPRDIVLTGSGTESIDLAIRGTLAAVRREGSMPLIVTTRVEHSAVRELVETLSVAGEAAVHWLLLDVNGLVDLAGLRLVLRQRPAIVSVQWANNETGIIQPVDEIYRVCKDAGVTFHCDATQWVGKMPIPKGQVADLLTFSPHKFHGPKGVGVLVASQGVRLSPRLIGTQELGRRGGTENVPGILGAGVAADQAATWLADANVRLAQAHLRDRLEKYILDGVPGAVVNGGPFMAGDPRRLWNTTNIGFSRLEAEALLIGLSERGVAASAGAACSSGSLDPSPVLLAMGIAPEVAHGSLRFSLSRDTTEAEVDEAAAIVIDVARKLYSSMAGLSGGSTQTLPGRI